MEKIDKEFPLRMLDLDSLICELLKKICELLNPS